MIYKSPEKLFNELGITSPDEIDVEAIGLYCGAIIKYRKLDGCEARIIGDDKKAIISVNESEYLSRNRFSAAHELGHWANHRGTLFLECQKKDIYNFTEGRNPEAIANMYAADLLMPKFLFDPLAKGRNLTLSTASELADTFRTSLTSTAIRLLKYGSFPGMLVCYDDHLNRIWFSRTHDIPYEFMPPISLHYESQAFDVLHDKISTPTPTTVNASLWIQHKSSYNYSIVEQSIKITPHKVLTMLWWKDESQLLELLSD